MGKLTKNQTGFGVTGVMFIIVIILLGVMGYLVYKNHNKAKATTTSSTKSTTATTAPNPYSGWKTFTLQYEKISFKYPSNWTLAGSSTPSGSADSENISPGSDYWIITDPNNIGEFSIVTGTSAADGGASSIGTVISSSSIKTLGKTYYLDYYNNSNQNTNEAEGVCVGTSANSQASYPTSLNITAKSGTQKPVNNICFKYANGGGVTDKLVSAFNSDPIFKTAEQIIESMTY